MSQTFQQYPCCEAVKRHELKRGDNIELVVGNCPIHGISYSVSPVRVLVDLYSGLLAELRAVYQMLEDRHRDTHRCPRHPKGERCALPIGHEGSCKWGRGD